MKRVNVFDLASGAYLGLRFAEPTLLVMKGEWDMDGWQKEIKYRFAGIGGNGELALAGPITTYVPPIAMQLIKKGMHKMGFRFNLGPFSF